MNHKSRIEAHFEEHCKAVESSKIQLINSTEIAASKIVNAFSNHNKLLCCGNGGSSGDASHLASELINRFEMERAALPAIALTTDSAVITSIANDYLFDKIFSRQIEALGLENDLLIAFSTSGNSSNIITAIKSAHEKHLDCIVFTGNNGGAIRSILKTNDIEICVDSNKTSRVQEIHLIAIHAICDLIDKQMFSS